MIVFSVLRVRVVVVVQKVPAIDVINPSVPVIVNVVAGNLSGIGYYVDASITEIVFDAPINLALRGTSMGART